MVADISEAVALEDAMQVMVDLHRKGDKQAVQKQIAVALSCVSRLNQKHDTVLASYRDQLDLVAAVKSEYRDASMRLDEHRGAQMAVLAIMSSVHGIDSSSSLQTPAELRQELEIDLGSDENALMESDEPPDAAAVVQMLVNEYEERQALQQKLDDVHVEKQALLAEVAKKREHVSGIQGLVPEISKRAKTAFDEVGMTKKLPAVERVSAENLPTPLYVVYSNFILLKAASGADFQVENMKPDQNVPGGATSLAAWQHAVRLTVPRSKGSGQPPGQPCVLNFGFCEDMNTVLADCDSHNQLLDSIASSDDGLSWPHSVHSSDQGRQLPARGRPYKWCQHLGGLDLLLLPAVAAAGDGAVFHTFSSSMFIRRVKHLLGSKFR